MKIAVIDKNIKNIGVKIFKKYGSCKIEYINNKPHYYYMQGHNDWVYVNPLKHKFI